MTATAADVETAGGARNQDSRRVYELTSRIEPGNSGGPLITASGAVIGVVFARSTTSVSLGYALTAAQVASAVDAAASLDHRVSTGQCSG